ncbi:alpha/beta hydrolase [Microbulbifer halophilus]|uniref:Alpha/beta hydrolase n=1 Tax=Microbulbifer halophilus TaxID=453963 RepID=A0ABW5EBY5_9GAMM|nr:alpha/beta hydrolase [Microbulbifer halophilus]MCW8125369.1 alpha/beta hydrolase [Microbulbifer halophilus]
MQTIEVQLLSFLLAFAVSLCGCPPALSTPLKGEEKFTFETWSKQKADRYRGSFSVPENGNKKQSRAIPIKYVRFPATGEQAGASIVYLAGGPGGSGIAAVNYRFGMFMALREYGDVIALDQRGTGASDVLPTCRSGQAIPSTIPVSDRRYIEYHREALRECLAFWRESGVDLAGYNTVENARDLDALRRHLGAGKIVLWGTSYGSHLALAALKEMEDRIEKVIISSAEGLHQAVRLPARTDAYLERLQTAINSQPAAREAYPDIEDLMRRVHRKLDREPLPMQMTRRDGSRVDYLLQRRDMQLIASSFIADPKSAARLLDFYRTLGRGGKPDFATVPARYFPDAFLKPGEPISMDAMPTAMDIASGIDANRKAKIARQAGSSLLKDYLNFSYHYDGIAPELDLGQSFRTAPASDVPVLLLSGTLDGRTTLESQRKAVSGLTELTGVTVENAGHNLFMASTEVQQVIDRFMESRPIKKTSITVSLPNMAPLNE